MDVVGVGEYICCFQTVTFVYIHQGIYIKTLRQLTFVLIDFRGYREGMIVKSTWLET
jgi:hypothetical protein